MTLWVENLLTWFAANRRPMPWREDPCPYKVWISEIMLQQTQVATVIPYFERFLQEFPDVESLAQASVQNVLKLWEGLGYYARARNLLAAAKRIATADHFPQNETEWLQIPGVGDYTAAAIASIASGEPVPAIDGNVLRVCTRFRGIRAPAASPAVRKAIRTYLTPHIRKADPSAFNQAMMELGALICRPKSPRCGACPLHPRCTARIRNLTSEIPCKPGRTALPSRIETVALIYHTDGRLLIRRRPEAGLLGGLWEFPGGVLRGHREPLLEALQRVITTQTGLTVTGIRKRGVVRHAFSHFSQILHVFECHAVNTSVTLPADAMRWAGVVDITALPLSKAQRRITAFIAPGKSRQAPSPSRE